MPGNSVEPQRHLVAVNDAKVFVAAFDLITYAIFAYERCDRAPCFRQKYRGIKDQKRDADDD